VFNGLNNSTHHLLYSYIKIVNVTLYAGISTWTTPKGVVNPTINVTEGDLVMFTVVNKDNLSHSLMINAGKGESVGTAVNVVTVAPGVANATGYFLFSLKGTYTYWDFYHSSTAVGIINSSASSTASSAIGEIPYQ
jgi:FtsP/CotA-like multicopper oxidase with cupredoxin domain